MKTEDGLGDRNLGKGYVTKKGKETAKNRRKERGKKRTCRER